MRIVKLMASLLVIVAVSGSGIYFSVCYRPELGKIKGFIIFAISVLGGWLALFAWWFILRNSPPKT